MKQDWSVDPLPPPENSSGGMDGFISLALLALAIIGPLIYFGDELGFIERYVVSAYLLLEGWLLPLDDWF